MSANHFLQQSMPPIDVTVNSIVWGEPITADMQTAIQALPLVNNTVPRIEEHGSVFLDNGTVYLIVIGIDLQRESHIGKLFVSDGELNLTGHNCFITEEARDLINASLGDELGLHLSSGLAFFNVTGIGITVDKGIIGPVVFVSLETAWDLFHIRYPNQSVNKLLIEVYDVFDIPIVIQQVQQICGEHFRVTNIKAYSLMLAQIFISQAALVLSSLVIVACAIASFRVFSSFASVFQARRYETGVVLAFGASRRGVLSLFLSEILVIAGIGCAVGIFLGVAIGNIVLWFISLVSEISFISPTAQYFQISATIDIASTIEAVLIGLALTFFSGYLPAWRASRESVVESLGRGSLPMSGGELFTADVKRRVQLVLGVLGGILSGLVILQLLSDLFGLGIVQADFLRIGSIPVFLLLVASVSPRIHYSNAVFRMMTARSREVVRTLTRKNLRRNALTALIVFNLFCSVTVLFLASTNISTTITESWRRNINWNTSTVNIVTYFNEPHDTSLVEQLKSQSTINDAVGMNQALESIAAGIEYKVTLVMGIQGENFEQMASIAILDSMNATIGLRILDLPDSCVLSDFAANTLSVNVGDRIHVAQMNLTVVAICASSVPAFVMYAIEPMFMLVSPTTWTALEDEPFQVNTVLIESSDPEATMISLSNIPGAHPVLVSEIQADYAAALESIQVIINSSLLALFIATTISAVLSGFAMTTSRRREIGMLAALGMDSEDIAKALTFENAITMTTGTGIGVLVGLIVELSFQKIIIRFGVGGVVLFDAKTIILIILSWLTSIVMSYFAIKRATNQNPVTLLRDQQRNN